MAGEQRSHVKFFLKEGHAEEGDCALGLQDTVTKLQPCIGIFQLNIHELI